MRDAPTSFRPLVLLLAALGLLAASPVCAGERHYMLIFASTSRPKLPRLTHTFGTIVRVVDGPPGCAAPIVEAYTISWLPTTLKVHPYRLHNEPGNNLTLEQSLCWSEDNHMEVLLWGPYAIEKDFFDRVYNEYARIERGEFRYKAIDPRQRGSRTTDCIHAVTDVDRDHDRYYYPFLFSGERATRRFVRVLRERGRLMDPPEDTCWMEAALGLDKHPVVHRPTP